MDAKNNKKRIFVCKESRHDKDLILMNVKRL